MHMTSGQPLNATDLPSDQTILRTACARVIVAGWAQQDQTIDVRIALSHIAVAQDSAQTPAMQGQPLGASMSANPVQHLR